MRLNITFKENAKKINAIFEETKQTFKALFGEVQQITEYVGGELYTGDYFVTPKVDAQEMPTKGKVMGDNITIKSIPYFDVSNNSGGSTVFIAEEI